MRARADRLASMTLMCLASAAIGAVGAAALPAPAVAAWPFIALSSLLQTLYCLTLVEAYGEGLLAEVYPLARGVAPMLVTLSAWLAAREAPGWTGLAGVGLVSAGVLAIGFGRGRLPGRALGWALASGVLIAAYTLTDGLGVRRAGSAASYEAWMFLAQGLCMLAAFALIRRRPPPAALDGETVKSLIGGALSLVSYGVVVWALSLGPMGAVSALRETGILFAMLIGVTFLRERPAPIQFAGGAAIAAGALTLALG